MFSTNINKGDSYLLIANVLKRVTHDAHTHVDQVGRGHLEHGLGELLTIFVNFLKQQCGIVLLIFISNSGHYTVTVIKFIQVKTL